MTLLALSLSVGMLIDDAIVVLENVFRHMEEGMPRREAAEFGTAEIGLAVMATTFSIAAVFVPVAFMQGIIGRFFYSFGMTVTCAVLLSLFVSFTLTLMLCSRFLTIPERHGLCSADRELPRARSHLPRTPGGAAPPAGGGRDRRRRVRPESTWSATSASSSCRRPTRTVQRVDQGRRAHIPVD
jgi:multidrug efflux pump subunit AcrB